MSDEAVTKFFGGDADSWNNACINFSPAPMLGYVEGYWRLADQACEGADTADLDRIVYPVVFLFRQYVELGLKSAIAHARRLNGAQNGFPNHHRIDSLWGELKGALKKIDPTAAPSMKALARCVAAFAEIDPEGEAFRYPATKDGMPTLNPTIRRINLRRLREQMACVHSELDALDAYLAQLVELDDEMRREYAVEY